MAWSIEKWILNYLNSNRTNGEEITLQNAKEEYISAEERLCMEQTWGAEKITEIFGEASHLQKAEIMLLEIEQGEITQEKKYEYLIDIAYQISYACGKELDSNNPIWDKYSNLSSFIPIVIMEREDKVSLWFSPLEFYGKIVCISAENLEKMKTWLFSAEEAKENLPKKAFFQYIFELTYISLKEIFKEVKPEIEV